MTKFIFIRAVWTLSLSVVRSFFMALLLQACLLVPGKVLGFLFLLADIAVLSLAVDFLLLCLRLLLLYYLLLRSKLRFIRAVTGQVFRLFR